MAYLYVTRENQSEAWELKKLMEPIHVKVEVWETSESKVNLGRATQQSEITSGSHSTASALVAGNEWIQCVCCKGSHFQSLVMWLWQSQIKSCCFICFTKQITKPRAVAQTRVVKNVSSSTINLCVRPSLKIQETIILLPVKECQPTLPRIWKTKELSYCRLQKL